MSTRRNAHATARCDNLLSTTVALTDGRDPGGTGSGEECAGYDLPKPLLALKVRWA
ncbi:MAG: hypothetical protein R2867_43560 [Caldilineaceae bacterium]